MTSTTTQAIAKRKRKPARELTVEDFYFLKIGNMWRYMKTQHFSFWMICCYIFFEYSRPQAIFPVIDILPWAQLFIILSFVGLIIDPSVKWVKTPVNGLINIFALLVYVSSIYAYKPEVSATHFIDFYGWYVVYYLIINIVNTKERLYLFIMILVLSMAKIAIGTAKGWAMRGFAFTSWGLMGPKGYFQNSGELAILMLCLFPLAYYLFEISRGRVGKVEKYMLILFWVAPVLTILGASSRGGQVALAVQLLIMFRKKIFKVRKMLVIGVFLSLVFALLPDEQKYRFSKAGEDKTSVQRLLYWKHGLDMIKEYPVLGVGFFNFPAYYEAFYPEDMLYKNAQLPHNIFVQVGTDMGVAGMILLALFLVFPVATYISKRKDLIQNDIVNAIYIGTAYGLLGFAVAGQFVTVLYYPFLWIGMAVLVCCVNVSSRKKYKGINGR